MGVRRRMAEYSIYASVRRDESENRLKGCLKQGDIAILVTYGNYSLLENMCEKN